MDNQVTQNLIQINQQFYQSFAASFSISRYALQPGVKMAVARYITGQGTHQPYSMLDIGCGNGGLARYLAKTPFNGTYTGLDSSSELLRFAGSPFLHPLFSASFREADITNPGWHPPFLDGSFDRIVSFAVMHHIPSSNLRQEVFTALRRLLAPGGLFIHSCWQFLNDPRLTSRIVPWETVDLDQSQVETGDFLLDWRAEKGLTGYRYIHLFSEAELSDTAMDAGFKVIDSYYSDGRGKDLAYYQVWQSAGK